ncbi:MAG: hypothetical protein WCI95_05385 [bacterium]
MSKRSTIRSQLTLLGKVIRLSEILFGTIKWMTLSLGTWLLLFIIDNLLNLPAAIRLPLAVAGGGLLVSGLVRNVLIPVFKRVNAEQTAVVLEQSQGVRNNLLINACQLEAQTLTPGETLFAAKTINLSAGILSAIPSRSLWERQLIIKWGLSMGLLVVIWLAYGMVFPRYTFNALVRFAIPLGDIPPAGSVLLAITPSTDIVVSEGADLTVSAFTRNQAKQSTPGSIPVIIWQEGHKPVAPVKNAHQSSAMLDDSEPGQYRYMFRAIQRSFSFRVLNEDTYSRSIQVTVLPKPKITASKFRITPPAYTGLASYELAGPPATAICLPTAGLEVQMEFDQTLDAVTWNCTKTPVAFKKTGKGWIAHTILMNSGPYGIEIRSSRNGLPSSVATGEVQLDTDHPPELHFVTDNSNLFVEPGTKLSLTLQATDDYGMSNIVVTCRAGDDFAATNGLRVIKQWTYSGPPGNTGPVRESFSLEVEPYTFNPGETYLIEASSCDFRPGTKPGRSKPIVLRIKSIGDLTIASGDVLAGALNLLKQTISMQKTANETTDNLSTHLEEAVQGKNLEAHRNKMQKTQEEARAIGLQSIAAFRKYPVEGHPFEARLNVLAENEMGLALKQIEGLKGAKDQEPSKLLIKLTRRQTYILNELIALLGSLANDRNNTHKADKNDEKNTSSGPTLRDEKAAELSDEIKTFERAQKQIINSSKDLLDKRPEDLTRDEKEEILGALARNEAEWAKFLEEKLTDFAKLPLQDFSDASVAKQLNEVIQDIDKAAEALYKQKTELAVPLEQSGLEKAEELVNNLEKWLSNKPDNLKWSMEEPDNQADIPLAELPAELEDIVGDLLDKEDEMQDDVEDVSSSWLDSIDKGAGWDAADGPISSMSAKGVTGNMLPNQQEIGGRSGEGRSGRSQGQMVQDTAVGKGGRPTPTRLSPSPFEPGSVKDSSQEDTGGATGGGRQSGFSEPGLHGPSTPPPEKMARIAGNQAKIRQEAEALALKLRKYKLPSGDIEAAIAFMKKLEEASKMQNGLRVRRTYNSTIDSLVEARKEIRAEVGLHREQSKLPESTMREIMTGFREGTPMGYEELVSDYFRRMAGETQ